MDNENSQQINIKDNVLRKIESGEVLMRSKTYFTVKIGILIALSILTFFVTIFLVSYLIFNLKTGGYFFLLGFGTKGFFKFFLFLPWFILLINILLLIFLDSLLRRFKFGYHRSILYLFLGTLVFVTFFSTLVNLTSFHEGMFKMAESKKLPVGGGLYDGIKKPFNNNGVVRGTITSIGNDYFVMSDGGYNAVLSDSVKVFVPNGFFDKSGLVVGDDVIVAGDFIDDSEIRAFGIHKI